MKPAAHRQLSKLPRALQVRIGRAIDALAHDPRPSGVLKLKGFENRWRIRVGDYRVIYEIFDDRIVVVIVKVKHRSQAYDRDE